MSNPNQTAQGSAATVSTKSPTFKQMNLGQKCVFVGKAAICIMSFGFLFSHIFSSD